MQCPYDESSVAHFRKGYRDACHLSAFNEGVAAGVQNLATRPCQRRCEEVLTLGPRGPLLSFDHLHLRGARHQRRRKKHKEPMDDRGSTRALHRAALWGG